MAPSAVRFDNRIVVITSAGNDLGKGLGLFLASRGASVIVNDESTQNADAVVHLIRENGGKAAADYNARIHGGAIVEHAIKIYGSVDVLINNSSALPHVSTSFNDATDSDWDSIQKDHVFGPYKTFRAAWPHLKKQKYGRIVNIVSTTALSGNAGQAAHAAAEFAMVGFSETLSKEGFKHNILANVVMLRPSMDGRVPELAISLTALLSNEKPYAHGSTFEVAAGSTVKLHWERTHPHGFKVDASLTPSAILKEWESIADFSVTESDPNGPWDAMEMLAKSELLPSSTQGEKADFQGKVAVVTGAGNGLGRQYALLLAKLGARVVVNDLANPQATVDEIRKFGGTAVSDKHSVEDGDKVIGTALKAFGAIHILINNAGILRDKSFQAMTDDLWTTIQNVHLRGSYKTAKAAWPFFLKQRYGRIINTTSVSGIYGNFGQTNYAAAKCGIIGLSCALSREGEKYNIRVNTVAPSAGTQLTRTVMPEDVVQALKPGYVAPFVVALVSDNLPDPWTGCLYEIGSGFIALDRLRRSMGEEVATDSGVTPEALGSKWTKIVTRSNQRSYSRTPLPESKNPSNQCSQKPAAPLARL